jgi:hypothetical protein
VQLGRVAVPTIADTAAAGALEAVTLLGNDNLLVDLANSDNPAASRSPILATLEAPLTTIEAVHNVPLLR